MKYLVWTSLLIAASAVAGPLPVAVSVGPQAALVEAVGGDLVTVQVAVPPGASPHVFDPTPRQVAALASARLYVAAGVEIELQLLPRLKGVTPGLQVIGPRAHGHDHDHDDGQCGDPHWWLDPREAATQVRLVAEALAGLDPAHASTYAARAETEAARCLALHEELAGILAPVRGRDLVVAHPAFGRLAAYGLHQIAVEHEGHQPSPRQLAAVLARVRERGATTLFIQPQFPEASARGLAEAAGVSLVMLDPLAADYHENMRHMARTIAACLAPADAPDSGS